MSARPTWHSIGTLSNEQICKIRISDLLTADADKHTMDEWEVT